MNARLKRSRSRDRRHRRATGGCQVLSAGTVVANADLGYVYRALLPDGAAADRIDRKEYGCSTIMFYWGLDKQYPRLGPHNLFLCGDYRRSFEDIFKRTGMPDEPNFYIHAPSAWTRPWPRPGMTPGTWRCGRASQQ